jgi:hypothetical protein
MADKVAKAKPKPKPESGPEVKVKTKPEPMLEAKPKPRRLSNSRRKYVRRLKQAARKPNAVVR